MIEIKELLFDIPYEDKLDSEKREQLYVIIAKILKNEKFIYEYQDFRKYVLRPFIGLTTGKLISNISIILSPEVFSRYNVVPAITKGVGTAAAFAIFVLAAFIYRKDTNERQEAERDELVLDDARRLFEEFDSQLRKDKVLSDNDPKPHCIEFYEKKEGKLPRLVRLVLSRINKKFKKVK